MDRVTFWGGGATVHILNPDDAFLPHIFPHVIAQIFRYLDVFPVFKLHLVSFRALVEIACFVSAGFPDLHCLGKCNDANDPLKKRPNLHELLPDKSQHTQGISGWSGWSRICFCDFNTVIGGFSRGSGPVIGV